MGIFGDSDGLWPRLGTVIKEQLAKGLTASRGRLLGDGRTSTLAQLTSIVADGRLEVCDGAHWAFVMKKGSAGVSSSAITDSPLYNQVVFIPYVAISP